MWWGCRFRWWRDIWGYYYPRKGGGVALTPKSAKLVIDMSKQTVELLEAFEALPISDQWLLVSECERLLMDPIVRRASETKRPLPGHIPTQIAALLAKGDLHIERLYPRDIPATSVFLLDQQSEAVVTEIDFGLAEAETDSSESEDRLRPSPPVFEEHEHSILKLVPVIAHAIGVFGDEGKASHWLTTPLPIFENRSPAELIQEAGGLERVEQTLTRIEHNIPS